MNNLKNNYIKSPTNYVGGKHKLLPQILPLFPKNIGTFVDLFGGGCNVAVNVTCDNFTYNDISSQIVELFKYMKVTSLDDMLSEIDSYIEKYQLSKENKDGYLQLRDDYNNGDKTPMKFYTLLCYAFNNQIRFNSKGEYNMPFGKDRSSFNPTLREKFIRFVNEIQSKNCEFVNYSFEEVLKSITNSEVFVYADPPYYNSVASYNENGGWTKENEKTLLDGLDQLDLLGVNFALSNNLKYDNPLLDEWKEKYKVHYLNGNYSNCNYQKKDKSKDVEVLITNY